MPGMIQHQKFKGTTMTKAPPNKKCKARWYFGGIAGSGAACITHPLDLIKVHLQTSQEKNTSISNSVKNVFRRYGFLSLYNGISASVLRQLTYTTTRFGIYEIGKDVISTDSFIGKIALAGGSGFIGGFIGTPADMINVRMQNDVKLPVDKRRNYKHAIDGLLRVHREEGFTRLFSGATAASTRGLLMTVGQLAFYDQIKCLLLQTQYFSDNLNTHFTASLAAGAIATGLTQPADVIKTRLMNAAPGEFKGLGDVILYTAKLGPIGFFKGFIPAFVRLGPHTILTFIFFEQLRLNFGYLE